VFSGVGDDANPCSRTAPCKTWVGAISKTFIGGEINALDPGGYGPVTITKSITLDGGSEHASILAVARAGRRVVRELLHRRPGACIEPTSSAHRAGGRQQSSAPARRYRVARRGATATRSIRVAARR
jgi:hypothetical protein